MRSVALLLLLAASGCSDSPTAPVRFGDPVPITATPVDSPTSDVQGVYAVTLDRNLLEIYGRIITPDPCYDLSAYRTISGKEVRVTVVATRRPRGCDSSVDHFRYDVVSDAPACPHLSVWHHTDGAAETDVEVFDGSIC